MTLYQKLFTSSHFFGGRQVMTWETVDAQILKETLKDAYMCDIKSKIDQ